MNKIKSKIYFVVLTMLLVGGFPNFMAQEVFAVYTGQTFTNIADNNRISADATVTYNLINDDGTGNADAGTITFVRTGGNADAGTHTYTMVAGDLTASAGGGTAHAITIATLEGDGGFDDLVSGTIYTVSTVITGTAASTISKTGVTYDETRPTMISASVTSSTTIDVTFSEDILDAESGDFTLDSGLTVAGIAETNGVVTITTNEVIGSGVQPAITLGADFVTDLIDVGTVNTAVAGTVTVGNNAASVESSNGSGCDDCEAPTLGVNSESKRIVENGFTYNGGAVDAERFFTPYPLITATVGKQNTAVFKIYEDKGPENIKHFSFAFGLDKGEHIGKSKAMIELDIDHEGTEIVTVTDPENALDSIKVSTDITNCNGSDSDTRCLTVTIDHRFRAPLDFNIVGTDVWDMQRNSWQNYFNHGIEVTGKSLNSAKKYSGIDAGHVYHLTEISKTTAIDEFGNSWSFQYGKWVKNFVKNERISDTTSISDRLHSNFADYKELQIKHAMIKLLEICPTCLTSYDNLDEPFEYSYPNEIDKLNNPEIMQKMISENKKAQLIMSHLLDPILYLK